MASAFPYRNSDEDADQARVERRHVMGLSRRRERSALINLPPWMSHTPYSPGHVPVSSPDAALNAFAQLVTLRLNVDRALISLIDGDQQYILAEATKPTPYLSDINSPDDDNSLILGTIAIPRSNGLCECALNAAEPVMVVPNIQDDAQLCNRNFTLSRPEIKFYAACPITVDGLRIGMICVYDKLMRSTLTVAEKTFFVEAASNTAQHLASSRTKRVHERSMRLLAALESLISPRGSHERDDSETSRLMNDDLALASAKLNLEVGTSSSDAQTKRHSGADQGTATDKPVAHKDALLPKLPEADTSHDLLGRASELLLQGFGADGVFLFDAGQASSRQLRWTRSSGSGTGDDSMSSEDEPVQQESDAQREDDGLRSSDWMQARFTFLSRSTESKVLASAESQKGDNSELLPAALQDQVLRRLLRKYPNGGTFHVGDDGHVAASSEDDEEDQEEEVPALRSTEVFNPGDLPAGAQQSLRSSRNGKRVLVRLTRTFPKARSIAFFPLWDSNRQRWFAGGFAISNSQKQLIFKSDYLRFLSAFSICIMGGLAQRDARLAEAQKETFLSMISHELRSPLHGVLANVDLLRDLGLNPFQTTLLDTIDGCGHSLLDTINHILDHTAMASMDGQSRQDMHKPRHVIKPQLLDYSSERSLRADSDLQKEEYIDVVAVTEETISGLTADLQVAARSRRNLNGGSQLHDLQEQDLNCSRTVMIFAIQPQDQWILRLRTAAFRRILSNLVGNSIKFTSSGTIEIALRRDEPKGDSAFCEVTLQVADTGEGISEDFLQHHLSNRFEQENSHSVGSGLGVSIVRQLVQEINGTVDIRSVKGKGTVATVKFSCELRLRMPSPLGSLPLRYLQKTLGKIKQDCRGLTVCFVIPTNHNESGGETVESIASSRNSVAKVCREWFELTVTFATKPTVGNKKINLVDESYLRSKPFSELQNELDKAANHSDPELARHTPTIFIGASEFVAALHSEPSFRANENLFFVSNPCGPYQLGRILSLCVEYMPEVSHSPPRTTAVERVTEPSPRLHEQPISLSQTPINDLPIRPRTNDVESGRDQSSKINPEVDGEIQGSSAAQNKQDEANASVSGAPTAPLSSGTGNPLPTVMLVEDNNVNMKILEVSAKRLKVVYSMASNGADALELFTKSPLSYDIIWMDIMMPKMDGITATQHIRAVEKNVKRSEKKPPVQIIALTGLSSAEIRGEAQSCGMDAFFTKPVKISVLKESVEQWVNDNCKYDGIAP